MKDYRYRAFRLLKPIFLFVVIGTLIFNCTRQEKLSKTAKITNLKCEYMTNPLGLENKHPLLSWQIASDRRGEYQTAYQILVASSVEKLKQDNGNIWNTGKVESSQSIQIPFNGKPLKSRKRYYWKVRIWDKDHNLSAWSAIAWWEMGLLDKKDWKANWISAPRVFDWNKRSESRMALPKIAPPVHDDPAPIFRKEFKVEKALKSARLYICGLGYYEAYLNGEKIGDHILDPAFTNYSKRVLYVIYDVTGQIKEGDNVLGVMLGNGWYNLFTRAVWSYDRAPWRNDPVLLCQLELTFNDNSRQIITSDNTWKCAPGPIVFNGIRQGETFDANLEQDGWNKVGFNDQKWYKVRLVAGPKGERHAQTLPPIKIIKDIKPVTIKKLGYQNYLIDFGKNIAGFVKLKVKGKKGQKITIKYGERLNGNGRLDQKIISVYVREKRFQTDEYILKGKGVETWHPRFTYHGFRYIEVSGFPEVPNENNINACLVHTALTQKSYFSCSNELVNKIQEITLRSFLNNYHGYPTDCPHREKLGWLGDAQFAAETGLFNYEMESAYAKFEKDILESQKANGHIPPVVPSSGWGYQWNIGPAYDGAIVILPWNIYLFSGDKTIIEKVYPSLKKYFAYYHKQAKGHLLNLGLGDWCFAKTQTKKIITGTAYYYKIVNLLSKMAYVLNKKKEAQKYAQIASEIKSAYQKNFLEKGKYKKATQTTLGCALSMGLTRTDFKAEILSQLEKMLPGKELNLDFGVIGAKEVLSGLTLAGRPDIAYHVVNSVKYPGWGYWVKKGATTLWETWDGKDLSLDHVMFGSVSAWFYKTLAGLYPDAHHPGFKHFYVELYFPDDMDWVRAEMQSMYGKIKIAWEKRENNLNLMITVPVNSSATLMLPVKDLENVTEGGKPLDQSDGLQLLQTAKNDKIKIKVSSGIYHFRVRLLLGKSDNRVLQNKSILSFPCLRRGGLRHEEAERRRIFCF